MGDTLRLNQIFMNLLSNAVKFTQEGGSISFTAQEREQRGKSPTFRFTVADNGIGIAPEAQKIIFTPFERCPTGWSTELRAPAWGWPSPKT